MDNQLWRYNVIEVSRTDEKARDALLWEMDRSGRELVTALPGSAKDPTDVTVLTLLFKREAGSDIGI